MKYGITRGDGIKGEILELIMSMDLDEETGMPKIRNKILVKGREFYFVDEFDSEDEIQQNFVWYQMQNILVYCLPINDKHHYMYVEDYTGSLIPTILDYAIDNEMDDRTISIRSNTKLILF